MHESAVLSDERLTKPLSGASAGNTRDRMIGEDRILKIIRHALEYDRLVLFGQRIVPLSSTGEKKRRIEILMRLVMEDQRVVSPGVFIPVAERSGLIHSLDRYLIREVFSILAGEIERRGELSEVVNLNVSGATVSQPKFRDYVVQALTYYRLRPERICFEITETVAITDLDAAKEFVTCMQSMGAEVALDDFGLGFSTLGYLQQLPVDYLKIPASFVKQILATPMDQAVVESICKLAKRAGMETVAEGVEDRDTMCFLQTLGCDHVQGYLLHRPEPWPALDRGSQNEVLQFPVRCRAH
jgi:EAL domain-containing protein (putative c-di-GMP-specific phosphodiesterase class I)